MAMDEPGQPRPLLFVAMPFGVKEEPGGSRSVDFDRLHVECVVPAASAAGVESIRADEELLGGIAHKAMYERLLLAEIVIADLTFANANVFYELGVRHAARPRATILIYAKLERLPFDVAPIKAIPYKLGTDGTPLDPEALSGALGERLELAKSGEEADSPLFQLLSDYPGISLPHEVTETFRDRARWVSELTIRANEAARRPDVELARDELLEIERQVTSLPSHDHELLMTLMLAYRDTEAWGDMIRLAELMPPRLAALPTVREQLAMALNRRNERGDRGRAIATLEAVLEEHGDSPETLGILGRCFKSRWAEKQEAGDPGAADALDEAINAYGRGFAADPRDYYPGINLLTLLCRRGGPEDVDRARRLEPVVAFAVARKGGLRAADYWTRATVLELAALSGDEAIGRRALSAMLDTDPAAWMRATTADNLELYAGVVGGGAGWVRAIVERLRASR